VSDHWLDEVTDGADAGEQARLRRAHELLLAAGPPPEPAGAMGPPPTGRRGRAGLDSLRGARLAQALALAAVAALGVGLAIGLAVAGDEAGFDAVRSVEMHATPAAPEAVSLLEVGEAADDGNIPLRLVVTGLPRLPPRGYYELWLTRETGGRQVRIASCGTFTVEGDRTEVLLNAPYRLRDSPGWIVVKKLAGQSAEPVVLTT
jgi:hypothetical protein